MFKLFKTGVALLLLGMSASGFSAAKARDLNRAVLLISLDFENDPMFSQGSFLSLPRFVQNSMRSSLIAYPRRLQSTFFSGWKQRLNLEVIQRATAFDAWRELHNPQNIAVFWVSHAGDPLGILSSTALAAPISDWRGFDVSAVFQDVHPGLRAINVNGCGSANILRSTVSSQRLSSRFPNMLINVGSFGFANGTEELSNAIEMTTNFLSRTGSSSIPLPQFEHANPGAPVLNSADLRRPHLDPHQYDRVWKTVRLIITRKIEPLRPDEVAPPVRVMNGKGAILSYFGELSASNLSQSLVIEVPILRDPTSRAHQTPSARRWSDIFVTTGTNSKIKVEKIKLGEFTIKPIFLDGEEHLPESSGWKIRTNALGQALGVLSREFRFHEAPFLE